MMNMTKQRRVKKQNLKIGMKTCNQAGEARGMAMKSRTKSNGNLFQYPKSRITYTSIALVHHQRHHLLAVVRIAHTHMSKAQRIHLQSATQRAHHVDRYRYHRHG